MQALIGGGDHQGLDLEDMKQHVNYAGGYHPEHPVIMEFWKVCPKQPMSFLWHRLCQICCTHSIGLTCSHRRLLE